MSIVPASSRANNNQSVEKLVPLSVAAVAALCAWKLYKTCSTPVHPRCVTVVYDTRRRSVLCTSADRERKRECLPQIDHFSPLVYLSSLLVYSNARLIVTPPTSFFGTFTLPRSVFEVPGEAVDCSVESVRLPDGVVNMVVTVRYMIPFEQLERYLAAVGPNPPNERIALAVAGVARTHCAALSVGILISKSRREAVFMESFREHLATKLMSETAVDLVEVVVENVEIVEGTS